MQQVEGAVHSKYTNVRFQDWEDPDEKGWPVAQQITLAKHWSLPLRIQKNYQNSVMETIIANLEGSPGVARLQFVLVPASSDYQETVKAHIGRRQRQALRAQQSDPTHPGIGYVEDEELKGGQEMIGKAAYFVKIRLGTDSWPMGRAVFGAGR